jgi:hypothetical protein
MIGFVRIALKHVLVVPHYTSHVTLVASTSRCGQACVCVYSLLFKLTDDFLSLILIWICGEMTRLSHHAILLLSCIAATTIAVSILLHQRVHCDAVVD